MDKISTNIKDRILQIAEIKGISKQKFIENLNQKYANYKGISKYSSPSSDVIAEISSKHPDIDIYWLLTGKGEMLKKTGAIPGNIRMPHIITIPEKDSENENIEIVPVKLAAGYIGGGYVNEDFIKNLPKFRLPYLNNGTYRCFQVAGHSMEGGIKDNDWFIGRYTENLNNFAEGKIHAVIAPGIDSLLIKRVFRHPYEKERLLLRSDNNDEFMTYSDINVKMTDVIEMWSYAATVSFTEPSYDAEKFKRITENAIK